MVYCGVPSKACGACRAKRTKCDQAVPSCGQCRRARRDCPGYRDAQDLFFRNETNNVVTKARASRSPAARVASKSPPPLPEGDEYRNNEFDFNALSPSDSNTLVADVTPAAYNIFPLRGLALSLEDQGSSFFFHSFMIPGSTPLADFSSFLPRLYNSETTSGLASNPLPEVITAIGMAGISNLQRSPVSTTVVATRQKHTKVLRTLNAALQDPRTASADTTFAAVLLLGLFETMTCNSPQSLKSWAHHIGGATAIALVRGEKQVETEIGRHIFNHLRNQIMIDCLQRRRAFPPEILEWADLATEYDGGIVARRDNQLFQIIARLCALRSVHNPGGEVHDPIIPVLAKEIDSDLTDFVNGFPPHLRYTTKQCNISENVLSDYYHVYPNPWIVIAFNLYRVAQILTNEVILNWYTRNPTWDNAHVHRRQAETVLQRSHADICASVPFLLGDTENTTFLPRASAGIALVWPLYTVSTMDGGQTSTRAWVITRLEKIGHEMGIQQAASLAHVLKTKHHITAWDRFESTRVDEELTEW